MFANRVGRRLMQIAWPYKVWVPQFGLPHHLHRMERNPALPRSSARRVADFGHGHAGVALRVVPGGGPPSGHHLGNVKVVYQKVAHTTPANLQPQVKNHSFTTMQNTSSNNKCGYLAGAALCRAHSLDALRLSRWRVSSASTIPERAACETPGSIRRMHIRHRHIVWRETPSRAAAFRHDNGVPFPNIFFTSSRKRSGRWIPAIGVAVKPDQVLCTGHIATAARRCVFDPIWRARCLRISGSRRRLRRGLHARRE